MKRIKPGTHVEVTRANGEKRSGFVQAGPLEYLLHIGEFYHVGDQPPRPASGERRRRGTRCKMIYQEFGMYAPEDIRIQHGRPKKKGVK